MKGKLGGKRPGAGRKSKAEELKLAETIDISLGGEWVDDVLQSVYKEALKGSFQHQQLLLAYKYGKPQDKIDLTSGGKKITGHTVSFKDYTK